MAPPLAFDLTRLFLGPFHGTPRGIDRIDMGLAMRFFREWPEACFGILPLPIGARRIPRETCLKMLERLDRHWGEDRQGEDRRFAAVRDWIVHGRNPQPNPPPSAARTILSTLKGIARIVRQSPCLLAQSARRALPHGTVYLNTGQTGIAVPWFLRWLDRRPDVKPVIMLHDVIPLEFAEYVPRSSAAFHRNMVDCAARYAAGLIVTTKAAEASIIGELHKRGRKDIEIFAAPAPVPRVYMDGPEPDAELASIPYFVIVGAIEARKNHLLLLNVWRELVARAGKAAPKLVIVGPRWRTSSLIIDMLERSAPLQGHVLEAPGLPSPSLRRLLSNASGVLMPSFAEGFGLPIIEALALGTPAIASDIPAHLEAGGRYATYLSPLDGKGWLAAIQDHARNGRAHRDRIAGYTKWTWSDYHRAIEPFLNSVYSHGVRPTHPKA